VTERVRQTYDADVPVDKLFEHPENPRHGNVEAIDESMRVHGFYGAVVAQTGTGAIIAGNHRYRVAVARGEDTLPVLWLDVDDDQARRILLVDNRTGDLGGYDNEELEALLRGLLGDTDLGLAGTGYSMQDLADLFGGAVPDFEPDDSEQPRLDQTAPKECPQCGFTWRNGAGGEVIPT
jgi:hypothetical protein